MKSREYKKLAKVMAKYYVERYGRFIDIINNYLSGKKDFPSDNDFNIHQLVERKSLKVFKYSDYLYCARFYFNNTGFWGTVSKYCKDKQFECNDLNRKIFLVHLLREVRYLINLNIYIYDKQGYVYFDTLFTRSEDACRL